MEQADEHRAWCMNFTPIFMKNLNSQGPGQFLWFNFSFYPCNSLHTAESILLPIVTDTSSVTSTYIKGFPPPDFSWVMWFTKLQIKDFIWELQLKHSTICSSPTQLYMACTSTKSNLAIRTSLYSWRLHGDKAC